MEPNSDPTKTPITKSGGANVAMEKIKADLIGTGVFLERDTYEFLRKTEPVSFKVHREYPYSYGVHPVIVNGAIDVLGIAPMYDYSRAELVLVFPIECKKADPKLKHWVFEPHRSNDHRETPWFLFVSSQQTYGSKLKKESQRFLFWVTGSIGKPTSKASGLLLL